MDGQRVISASGDNTEAEQFAAFINRKIFLWLETDILLRKFLFERALTEISLSGCFAAICVDKP